MADALCVLLSLSCVSEIQELFHYFFLFCCMVLFLTLFSHSSTHVGDTVSVHSRRESFYKCLFRPLTQGKHVLMPTLLRGGYSGMHKGEN